MPSQDGDKKMLVSKIESEIKALEQEIAERNAIIATLQNRHVHQEQLVIMMSLGRVSTKIDVTSWERSYQHRLKANFRTAVVGLVSGLEHEIKTFEKKIAELSAKLSEEYTKLANKAAEDAARLSGTSK